MEEARSRRGYVPVLVGKEKDDTEKIWVTIKAIQHLTIVELLEQSVNEYGYQNGLLKITFLVMGAGVCTFHLKMKRGNCVFGFQNRKGLRRRESHYTAPFFIVQLFFSLHSHTSQLVLHNRPATIDDARRCHALWFRRHTNSASEFRHSGSFVADCLTCRPVL
ncbi:Auxin-induced protein, ARG7 [Spatholobus suberectus]|nr:Auxin-induced protein, ARG7 [Spatholobus suberectus]